jgi:membrane associated rhomboid family serine protease
VVSLGLRHYVEDRLGHLVFLAFYLLCGLAATACHWAIDPSGTMRVVGASGAVAAVLGAYAITYPKARVRCLVFLGIIITVLDLPALLVLGVWFVMQVISGLPALAGAHLGGGVAWWAHIGGFLVGLALMPLLGRLVDPQKSNAEWREWEDYF